MDARPSARADSVCLLRCCRGETVSMDARPSARADEQQRLPSRRHKRSQWMPGRARGRTTWSKWTKEAIEASQWMPGRARGRTRNNNTDSEVGGCLNGCPAERAGGHSVKIWSDGIDPVSMDAWPSARADWRLWRAMSRVSRLNGCPAERAGGPAAQILPMRCSDRLNGCPAERAGGRNTLSGVFSDN